jgi:hypothetical protein
MNEAPNEEVTRIDSPSPIGAEQAFPDRSLLGYAPAFVLLVVAVADSVQYADTDLWGHVRFGQVMLSTGHLLRADIFSYSAAGQPWINHEWLSEVVMALSYGAMGVVGLKLMKFLCAGAVVLLLAVSVGDTGAEPVLQFGMLLAAAFGLQLQIQFRPQLFDYIFLSALLALFSRARSRGRAPLWVVLPMMVLWANLHGGFFLGIVVLGVYAAATGILDILEGKGVSRALRLGLLTLAALLVTLINPYGIGEWRIVAHTLGNPYTMGSGAEFQSFYHVLAGTYRTGAPLFPFILALAVLTALPISFALAPCKDDLPELAIAALMVCLALYSVRNTALAVIACTAPIAFHLNLAFRRIGHSGDAAASIGSAQPDSLPPGASPAVQAAALVAAVAICLGNGLFSERLRDFTGYPVGAVAFMKQHRLKGRIFNELIWGSYIFWHATDSQVFIDGRFEMVYPPAVQRDYLDFVRGGSRAPKVLAAYPTDYVLMPSDSPAAGFVAAQEKWRMIYRDPVAALFARADSHAANIAGVPVLRDQAPPSLFP